MGYLRFARCESFTWSSKEDDKDFSTLREDKEYSDSHQHLYYTYYMLLKVLSTLHILTVNAHSNPKR